MQYNGAAEKEKKVYNYISKVRKNYFYEELSILKLTVLLLVIVELLKGKYERQEIINTLKNVLDEKLLDRIISKLDNFFHLPKLKFNDRKISVIFVRSFSLSQKDKDKIFNDVRELVNIYSDYYNIMLTRNIVELERAIEQSNNNLDNVQIVVDNKDLFSKKTNDHNQSKLSYQFINRRRLLFYISIILGLWGFGTLLYNSAIDNLLKKPEFNSRYSLSVKETQHLVYNNSIGNDWDTATMVNNKYVPLSGKENLDVSSNSVLELEAEARENDTYPDIGYNEKSFSVSRLNNYQPYTFNIDVTVQEDRGRYSGNTAIWRFHFTLQRNKPSVAEVFNDIYREVIDGL
jgi:hypothetical protein